MWYGASSCLNVIPQSIRMFFTHLPEATSQIRIVRSHEVVTRWVSSGEKHAEVIESVCPRSLVGGLEDLLSKRWISLLRLTAAIILLFTDTAMLKRLLDSSGGLKYTSSLCPFRMRM